MYKEPFYFLVKSAPEDRSLTKKNTYLRHCQERHYFDDFLPFCKKKKKKRIDETFFFFRENYHKWDGVSTRWKVY